MQKARLFWFVAVIASLTPVFAQTAAGVNGVILDSSGAAMPETQVAITNVDTGAKREALTNENGGYQFTPHQPGWDSILGPPPRSRPVGPSDLSPQVNPLP